MARTGLLKVWASLLAAVAGVLATATLANGAEAREAGCTGQEGLDAGHGGSDSGAVNARHGLVGRSRPWTSPGGSRRCWKRTATPFA
jgi:hypothetical protein